MTGILADLDADIAHAERQAADGPFYPERGITAESLRAYADDCRVERLKVLSRAEADGPKRAIDAFIRGRL